MYSRQFMLVTPPFGSPRPGWKIRDIGGMELRHAPDLPAIEFYGAESHGLLLGWPIFDGRMGGNGETLHLTGKDGPPLFRSVSGRFIALALGPDGLMCYLDPCGFLPAVYDPAQGMLASTPGLLQGGDETANIAFRTAYGFPDRNSWYPFGLTGSPGIRRLLPGHRLDLLTFTAHRYWPVAYISEDHDVGTAARVSRIGELLRENVAAVTACEEVVCNLTAGRDTRMILAGLRDEVDRLGFTTMRHADRLGEQDCLVAEQIAAHFGLSHQEIGCDEPIQADTDEWLANSGFCVGGRTMLLATTAKRIARMAKFNLTGLGGDIGRGVDWQRGDDRRDSVDIEELLERLGLDVPLFPELAEAGQQWLDGLPPGPLTWILDMALIELTLACCSCPSFYGHCHGGISISPFNDRRMIEQMLALPPAYRHAQKLAPDLIDLMWPELNLFLFNPMTTRRHLVRRQKIDILRRRIVQAFRSTAPGKTA